MKEDISRCKDLLDEDIQKWEVIEQWRAKEKQWSERQQLWPVICL